MSTWKKVALHDDIGVFAGGGSETELGGNVNDILLVGGSGDFTYLTPGSNTIVVGEGGVATNYTFATDGDVTATFDSGAEDITLNLGTGVVGTLEMAAGAVKLSKIAETADFDDEGSADVEGALLYWTSSNAAILEAGTQGTVLTINSSGLPEWQTSTATDTINILDGNAGTAAMGLLFGSEGDTGGLDADKVYTDGLVGDGYKLSYDPSVAAVSNPSFGGGMALSSEPFTTTQGFAALYSEGGFQGNLRGTATVAKGIETTGVSSGDFFLPMVKDSSQNNSGVAVGINSGVKLTPTSASTTDVTINGNLTVVGSATKVEIESAEVQIADFRILLAHSDTTGNASGTGTVLNSDQVQAAAGTEGVGFMIDNANETTENRLARFAYRGHKTSSSYQNSNSVLGWEMAQEVDNTASNRATVVGVGAMTVQPSYSITTSGGTADLDYGVGAMGWFGSNGLWIQTDSDIDA
jgi:hypothetical protein